MPILKYLQLPFYFDVNLLQEEVNHLSAKPWVLHYQKLHYEGAWTALPLRSVDGKTDDIYVSPIPNAAYSDTVFLEACPYLRSVLQAFECPLLSVRLLRLNAGAIIKEHRDMEMNFENGEIRLHVPVITHDEVAFFLDNERMHVKAGECWYMNFNLPHHVNNNSPIDRIHLVIDARVNDWVKALFSREDLPAKKEIATPDPYDAHTKRQMIMRLREMNTATANNMADELERQLSASAADS